MAAETSLCLCEIASQLCAQPFIKAALLHFVQQIVLSPRAMLQRHCCWHSAEAVCSCGLRAVREEEQEVTSDVCLCVCVWLVSFFPFSYILKCSWDMKCSCHCENKDVSADSRGLTLAWAIHSTLPGSISSSHAVQFGCFVIYAYLASVFIQIPWCHWFTANNLLFFKCCSPQFIHSYWCFFFHNLAGRFKHPLNISLSFQLIKN